MQRQSVSSSNLRSVGYDAASETLEIEFHSGGVYQYFNVPSRVYEELIKADSLGGHFNAHIRGAFSDKQIR